MRKWQERNLRFGSKLLFPDHIRETACPGPGECKGEVKSYIRLSSVNVPGFRKPSSLQTRPNAYSIFFEPMFGCCAPGHRYDAEQNRIPRIASWNFSPPNTGQSELLKGSREMHIKSINCGKRKIGSSQGWLVRSLNLRLVVAKGQTLAAQSPPGSNLRLCWHDLNENRLPPGSVRISNGPTLNNFVLENLYAVGPHNSPPFRILRNSERFFDLNWVVILTVRSHSDPNVRELGWFFVRFLISFP